MESRSSTSCSRSRRACRLDALREIAQQTLALIKGDPSSFASHARGAVEAARAAPAATAWGAVFARRDRAGIRARRLLHPGTGPVAATGRDALRPAYRARTRPLQAGNARLPFDMVARQHIAHALTAAARDRAWKQIHASLLIGGASITGIELEGADSPTGAVASAHRSGGFWPARGSRRLLKGFERFQAALPSRTSPNCSIRCAMAGVRRRC
ncbi:hypothetical protein ACTMU2_25410 [Cupriavidus basilensis]